MNMHKGARLTPYSRDLLVRRITAQGLRVEEAAHASGVSVRTAYKWLRRFREEGAGGLMNRSSRPHTCPHATPAASINQVIELRRARQTYRSIADTSELAPSTVGRLLQRVGLNLLFAWMSWRSRSDFSRCRCRNSSRDCMTSCTTRGSLSLTRWATASWPNRRDGPLVVAVPAKRPLVMRAARRGPQTIGGRAVHIQGGDTASNCICPARRSLADSRTSRWRIPDGWARTARAYEPVSRLVSGIRPKVHERPVTLHAIAIHHFCRNIFCMRA